MEFDQCIWNVYNDDTRGVLGVGLYIIGLCSLLLSCWLLAAFLKSLPGDIRYLTLLNLNIASLARCLLAGFLFSGTCAVAHRWMFGELSCKLFGFLRQFIAVYQMESLNHMCIDRYVMAKYIKNGWEVSRGTYAMYIGLCWTFSVLYNFPILLGLNGYSWDYSCTACSLDLILPLTFWPKFGFIVLLLLISLKPLLMMLTLLKWTRQIESQCYKEKEHQHLLLLTKSTTSIAWATMCCWTPGAVAMGWVVATQLMHGQLIQPPLLLAMLSSFSSEAAPGVIAISAFWSNARIRSAMMSLLGEPTHNKDS